MRAAVLQLNADYLPSRVIPWERAIELLLDGKALTEATVPGKYVRSAGGLVLPWPSVIRMARMGPGPRVRFTTANTLARDNWTCAYCGLAPKTREGRPDRKRLSFDHVVPKSRQRADGKVWIPWIRAWRRVTCWENGVCACCACNTRKRNRLPEEAGMVLRVEPRRPTYGDLMRITLARHEPLPAAWRSWVPESMDLTFRPEEPSLAATG